MPADAEQEPISGLEEDEEETVEEPKQEKPKHKGGRPRLIRSPAGLLPTPRIFDLPGQEFFAYWWSLKSLLSPHDLNQRVRVYPYRLWPVIDVTLPLPPEERERYFKLRAARKKTGIQVNLGLDTTAEPFDPEHYEAEILHRYGSGDYNFQMRDNHPEVKKIICMTTIRGLRDLEHYPPHVRPDTVVLTDPVNTSYIEDARRHGVRFPGDQIPAEIQQEQQMAAEKNAIETLANKVGELATARPADNGMSSFMGQFLTFMQQQSQHQQEQANQQARLMETLIRRVEALEKPAAPTAPPTDPVQIVGGLVNLAKTMIPEPAPPAKNEKDPMIDFLIQQSAQAETRRIEERKLDEERHKRELEMLAKRLESSEALVKETLAKQQTAASPSASTSELKKLIQGFDDIQELFKGRDESRGGPWWIEPAERAVENLTDMIKTIAAARAGVPLPVSGAASGSTGQSQAGSGTQPTRPLTQQEIQQEQERKEMDQKRIFMAQIHQSLVTALRSGIKGHEFAAQLMLAFNPSVYHQVCSLGINGLLGDKGILRSDPELYGQLRQAVMPNMGRLDEFVSEFLNSQEAMRAYEELQRPQQRKPEKANGGLPSDAPKSRTVRDPATGILVPVVEP